MYIVDIANIPNSETRDTLSGREEGRAAIEALAVHEQAIDKACEIVVRVPEHTKLITPSFFIGLLSKLVSNKPLDEAGVKITLDGQADSVTSENLEVALANLQLTDSPFAKLKKNSKPRWQRWIG